MTLLTQNPKLKQISVIQFLLRLNAAWKDQSLGWVYYLYPAGRYLNYEEAQMRRIFDLDLR
jgi:hypothetical protein